MIALPPSNLLTPIISSRFTLPLWSDQVVLSQRSCCGCSVAFDWIFCDPMDCSTPGSPVFHYLPEFAQTHVHFVVIPSNYLILCCPLLLLSSVFPSLRVFSNELALCISWPKYWSFSFTISPTNEYSGLISFEIDGFDLLVVQGTLKSLLHHHSLKASIWKLPGTFR